MNELPTRQEFIAKLHKQAAAVYLACDPSVAKDISESLSHAAMLLASQVALLSDINQTRDAVLPKSIWDRLASATGGGGDEESPR